MARCLICQHPKRLAIDKELLAGTPKSIIGRKFSVSRYGLTHHERKHLARQLVTATAIKEKETGMSLGDELYALLERAKSILETTETDGKLGLALKAIGESRNTIETLARIASMVQTAKESDFAKAQTDFEQRVDLLPIHERRQMLQLMSKMYPTERRPIEFAEKDLKRTWKKISMEDSDDDDNNQGSDLDEGDDSPEDARRELDFTTNRFPSDADVED